MEPIMNGEPELTSTLAAVLNEVTSNDLVMEGIIKHLDVPGLKNFRRVSSEWYRKSMKAWNEKAFVQIGSPEESSPLAGETLVKSPQNLVKFLKETCDENYHNFLGIQPFRNFSLSSGERNMDPREKREMEETMKNLWGELGKLASHLQLKIDSWDHSLSPILRELGPNVTTLEVIWSAKAIPDFTKVFLEGPAHTQVKQLELLYVCGFPRFNFLIKFPSLEELKLDYFGIPNYSGANSVISTLRTIRFSKMRRNACNLKHLDLIEASAPDLTAFAEVNLPLTYLTLRLNGGDDISNFQLSMKHYAKSLKTLKLRVITPKWKIHTPSSFPAKIDFGNLQVLEIWGYLTDNLNFLKGAPHLRKLRLDLLCNQVRKGVSTSDLEPFKIDSVQNIGENFAGIFDQSGFHLMELHELMIDFKLPEDTWKVLGHWMPNLRILGAPLDNTTFRLVCGQWPKLRKLECRLGSDIDDAGIVGESGHDGIGASGQPTILDMKYLEAFELEAPCGQGKMTDRSAEFGFLKMNYLRNLKAFVSPHLVSEGVEEQLRGQIAHVEIVRNCRNENIPLEPYEEVCCNWDAERKRLYFESLKR